MHRALPFLGEKLKEIDRNTDKQGLYSAVY